jgi:hypothetical protein
VRVYPCGFELFDPVLYIVPVAIEGVARLRDYLTARNMHHENFTLLCGRAIYREDSSVSGSPG